MSHRVQSFPSHVRRWAGRTGLSIALSFALFMALGASGSSAIAGPDLERVLSSVIGRFLMLETSSGRQLLGSALGRPLKAGESLDALDAFRARLAEAAAGDAETRIESRLRAIEREFSREFPERLAADAELTANQRAVLRLLSNDQLGRESIEFAATSEHGAQAYEASRQLFASQVHLAMSAPKPRYPAGWNPWRDPKGFIQYGFESEYTLRDLEGLVSVYGPAPEFGVTAAQWEQMPRAEQVAWVKANLPRLFPNVREMGGMVKLSEDPSLAFLPKRLLRDSTGNLEIVMDPCDTFEEWQRRIFLLNERLGVGSMQGTISVPSDAFFGRSAPDASPTVVEANLGFFSFHNDLDTLLKLEAGAIRFREDPTRAAANSFNHPFLGPMTNLKYRRLAATLEANAHHEMLDEATLRAISAEDNSFKYVGGTAYRPDIVRGRVVLEVRDAHTNVEALLDRMARSLIYLEHGRSPFAGAAQLPAFDSVKDFAKLPVDAQAMLRELFPAKTIAGLEYTPDELLAVEVYRNFAYPMRDWDAQLRFVGKTTARNGVRLAQRAYSAKLSSIAADLRAGRVTAEEASLRAQGAVAEFAVESRLVDFYRQRAHQLLRQSLPANESPRRLPGMLELDEAHVAELEPAA